MVASQRTTRNGPDVFQQPINRILHTGKQLHSQVQMQKLTNIWILNNILLNNWWVQEEITKEIRKCPVINENTTCRNVWDAAQRKIYS